MSRIKQFIINFSIFLTVTILTTLLALLLLPVILIFPRIKVSPVLNRIFCRRFSGCINKYFFRCRIKVVGKENIPSSDVQYCVISNHLSFFDISVFMQVTESAFIMKKSVIYMLSYGVLAHIFGAIMVDRENISGLKVVSKKMVAFIRAGLRIHLFPEGTRSRDGSVLPFKKGLLHKLYNEKIPVLCCALWNTQHIFPPDTIDLSKVHFFKDVSVSVGKLLKPEDYPTFNEFFEAGYLEVKHNLERISLSEPIANQL